MKIAVLSANVGGIDEVKPLPVQSVSCDYFLYTENNLPFPLHNLDNRLKGKYCKINTHRFLDHDIFIWLDGRVEITSPDFVKIMVDQLKDHEVAISYHPFRNNPYEEIAWIQMMMEHGNKYLLSRYATEPFNEEVAFYNKEGLPKDYPLYQCGIFARRNNERVNWIFRDWWLMCLEYSNFDQSQFSYVMWKNKVKIKGIDFNYLKEFLVVGKHL
jgi:hypothetical protein